MTGYKQIVFLNKKVQALEEQMESMKKSHQQELEKWKAWNEQDVKFIAKLRKEIKELRSVE